jgi:hypothetical protein
MAQAYPAIILLLTCLLFAVSVTILGLISHSLAYTDSSYAANTVATFQQTRSNYDADGTLNGTETSQNTFGLLPASLDSGSYWMIFAAGMGGVLDALLIALFMLRKKPLAIRLRKGKVRYSSPWPAQQAVRPRGVGFRCVAKPMISPDVQFPRFHNLRLRVGDTASGNWHSSHRLRFC